MAAKRKARGLMPHTSADILPPFAVIPLETPNAEASASIQDYAEACNSNLVYAQDEFGNNIAVGVFVTEEFHPFVKTEDLSMANPTENQDINWVAAVEECLTECNEYSSIENAAGSPQKDSIRVYKVKKQKTGRKETKGSSRNARKTLSELKKVKGMKSKQKVSPPKMKDRHISEGSPSCKKSRRMRKVYDKSYKPSCSVNSYNLGSKVILRCRQVPWKYNIYWDASIPMEYYEEEFLDFEKFAQLTGLKSRSPNTKYESQPEFILRKFEKYEKWMKADSKKEWKKYLMEKQKIENKIKHNANEKQKSVCPSKVQDIQYVCQNNDMNAIRLSLMKAISSTGYCKGSTCSNVKKVTIDLPCSPKVFKDNFVSNVPLINYCDEQNYKCTVTASHLDSVFGQDWDSFIYRGSGTKRRIIGVIVLHYRLKGLASSRSGKSYRSAEGEQISSRYQYSWSFWLRMTFSVVKENIQLQAKLQGKDLVQAQND